MVPGLRSQPPSDGPSAMNKKDRLDLEDIQRHLGVLHQGVRYMVSAQLGALEAQAASFAQQAQQIRWGGAQLPPGVGRDSAASQYAEAAEKIGDEVSKLEDILSAIEEHDPLEDWDGWGTVPATSAWSATRSIPEDDAEDDAEPDKYTKVLDRLVGAFDSVPADGMGRSEDLPVASDAPSTGDPDRHRRALESVLAITLDSVGKDHPDDAPGSADPEKEGE